MGEHLRSLEHLTTWPRKSSEGKVEISNHAYLLGYTYSVDLWSIGICFFEFMCGGVPFAEDSDDPYEIYEEI